MRSTRMSAPSIPTDTTFGFIPQGLKAADAGNPAFGASAGNTVLLEDAFVHTAVNYFYVGQSVSNFGHYQGGGINLLLLDGHAEFARYPTDRLKYKLGPYTSLAVPYYDDVPNEWAGW